MAVQKLGYDIGGVSAKERGHFDFGVVASGTKSLYIDVNGCDSLNVQIVWASTLAAATTVHASNSFICDPANMQTGTPIRAGTFTAITAASWVVITGADPAGSPGSQMIHIGVVSPCTIRIDVARSGGSGQLDMYVSGKATGR